MLHSINLTNLFFYSSLWHFFPLFVPVALVSNTRSAFIFRTLGLFCLL